MLEGLAQIDWPGLGIPELPLWLQQLLSQDDRIREQAFRNLGQNVVPTVALNGGYSSEDLLRLVQRDAVHLAVPFLIELLSHAPDQSKELILELLHDLAWYVGVETYIADSELGEYRQRARLIFNSVLKGIDVYKDLLGNDSPGIKQAVTDLIAILDKYRADSQRDRLRE